MPGRLCPASAPATSPPCSPGDQLGEDPEFRGSLLPWEPGVLCAYQKVTGNYPWTNQPELQSPCIETAAAVSPTGPFPADQCQHRAGHFPGYEAGTWDREAKQFPGASTGKRCTMPFLLNSFSHGRNSCENLQEKLEYLLVHHADNMKTSTHCRSRDTDSTGRLFSCCPSPSCQVPKASWLAGVWEKPGWGTPAVTLTPTVPEPRDTQSTNHSTKESLNTTCLFTPPAFSSVKPQDGHQ